MNKRTGGRATVQATFGILISSVAAIYQLVVLLGLPDSVVRAVYVPALRLDVGQVYALIELLSLAGIWMGMRARRSGRTGERVTGAIAISIGVASLLAAILF